MAVAAMQAGL